MKQVKLYFSAAIILFFLSNAIAQPAAINISGGMVAGQDGTTNKWVGVQGGQFSVAALGTGGQLNLGGTNGVYIPRIGSFSGNLTVEGTILTTRVKIAAPTNTANWNWADYVFAKEYKLKSLNEVESFIKNNKHLEGIPSAKEIHKDGFDLAPMTSKLLEKIEELTLYVIELNKKIEVLEKRE